MDLDWLEDILVLLEERNLSRAAHRRNVTQPAFSRRIRSFEDWLGIEVLERGPNRVELREALLANEDELRALSRRITDLQRRICSHDTTRAWVTVATQHALTQSNFPDLVAALRRALPGLRCRLRTANRHDCVSLFLRGDAKLLLCYEAGDAAPLPLDESVVRLVWGNDRLVPAVGGAMRRAVRPDGTLPSDPPAIVYPEDSHFGQIVRQAGCRIATGDTSTDTACETAYSNGIRDMVLRGLGVAWLPHSMIGSDLETGRLRELSGAYGSVPLTIALYYRTVDAALAQTLRAISPALRRADPLPTAG